MRDEKPFQCGRGPHHTNRASFRHGIHALILSKPAMGSTHRLVHTGDRYWGIIPKKDGAGEPRVSGGGSEGRGRNRRGSQVSSQWSGSGDIESCCSKIPLNMEFMSTVTFKRARR